MYGIHPYISSISYAQDLVKSIKNPSERYT